MIEVIVGGALMLVGGVVGAVVQHLLQRMRNKDEREARREDILYDKISDKQLEAFDEATKALFLMDAVWIKVVEIKKKAWLLHKTKGTREGEELRRRETLRVLGKERDAEIDEFMIILEETRDTGAKMGAYLPSVSIEAFQKYIVKAIENTKWLVEVVGEGEGGEEEDFKLAKELLKSEHESALASLREHMGIKERL